MKITALIVVAVLLASCSGMSTVVSVGKDTYMVSAGVGMYEQNPSGIRQKV
jgi:PBP1b-binding outer membrane lipoprotein LpoB